MKLNSFTDRLVLFMHNMFFVIPIWAQHTYGDFGKTSVRVSNSLDPNEKPMYSASRLVSNCLHMVLRSVLLVIERVNLLSRISYNRRESERRKCVSMRTKI